MLPTGDRNWQLIYTNEDKSAAHICHQVTAWVHDMFCNFYAAENHKIVDTLTIIEAREKQALFWNS